MKRIISAVLTITLLLSLCACGGTHNESSVASESNQNAETIVTSEPEKNSTSEPQEMPENTPDADPIAPQEGTSVLVVCFSATGNTMAIADTIAESLQADRFDIVPSEAYSEADLNYNSDCRANREQNDDSVRPGFVGELDNIEQYDVIFLGYPIWWGKLPKILYTFLEQYDLSGKTVIPFCTSGSSAISTSVAEIRKLQPGTEVNDGRRFAAGTDAETIQAWLYELSMD